MLIPIPGVAPLGRCDFVPGLGHICTLFVTFGMVPLFPLRSYLVITTAPGVPRTVVGQPVAEIDRLPVPLSWKSIGKVYLGFPVYGAIVFLGIWGMAVAGNAQSMFWAFASFFAAGAVGFLAYHLTGFLWIQPSVERSRQLIDLVQRQRPHWIDPVPETAPPDQLPVSAPLPK